MLIFRSNDRTGMSLAGQLRIAVYVAACVFDRSIGSRSVRGCSVSACMLEPRATLV